MNNDQAGRLNALRQKLDAVTDRMAAGDGTVDEMLDLMQQHAEIMDEACKLSAEFLPPEERAAQERYVATVIEPNAEFLKKELADTAEKHGLPAALRAAAGLFQDVLADLKKKP